MEKIYMEENKNKRSSTTSQLSVLVSTLAFALILIVGMVAVGVSRSSYAVPANNELPESFTVVENGTEIESNTGFIVSEFLTTDGLQVFCLEHKVNVGANYTLDRSRVVEDNGLLYLLNNVYPYKKFHVNNDASAAELPKNAQTWISQVAIWVYLNDTAPNYEVGGVKVNEITAEELAKIADATGLIVDRSNLLAGYYTVGSATPVETGSLPAKSSTTTFYDVFIAPLVNEAKSAQASGSSVNQVQIDMQSTISTTDDNKYYQSSLVTVTGDPSDKFTGYSVKLNTAPKGSIIVDVQGNEIAADRLANMQPTDKFYVRVPVKNVNNDNKTVEFSVTGSFSSYAGNYYVSEGAQTVTLVQVVSVNDDEGASFVLEVPNTKVNASQTLYFIGLLILLAGVGIVYANVKPSEE